MNDIWDDWRYNDSVIYIQILKALITTIHEGMCPLINYYYYYYYVCYIAFPLKMLYPQRIITENINFKSCFGSQCLLNILHACSCDTRRNKMIILWISKTNCCIGCESVHPKLIFIGTFFWSIILMELMIFSFHTSCQFCLSSFINLQFLSL